MSIFFPAGTQYVVDANGVPQPVSPTDPMPTANYVFDGFIWVPITSSPLNSDGQSIDETGVAATAAYSFVWNRGSNSWDRLQLGNANADNNTFKTGHLAVVSLETKWNGFGADRIRVANHFKRGKANVLGSTTIWSPTAGKKFRLMAYKIGLTGNAVVATAAEVDFVFSDGATQLDIGETLYVPATASGSNIIGEWVDLGNGYISATADNVLSVVLPVALASGNCVIQVMGTEE